MTYVSVIVDTNGEECVIASFGFGGDAITREYEIRVLQYNKQNELGGPAGCLQFFLATTGLVSTFNWRSGKKSIEFELKNVQRILFVYLAKTGREYFHII